MLTVSCICVTYNRPQYLVRAIKLFNKQSYSHKELIIIDDSNVPLHIPKCDNITYVHYKMRKSIGCKRNIALKYARGDVFMFWDDDDYYSTCRITKQVAPIINNIADITVFDNVYYYDVRQNAMYTLPKHIHPIVWYKGYACGTLTFHKRYLSRFKHISIGEDRDFIIEAQKKGARVYPIANKMDYVYTRHGNNSFSIPCSLLKHKKYIKLPNSVRIKGVKT